jgi:hypothetical protein
VALSTADYLTSNHFGVKRAEPEQRFSPMLRGDEFDIDCPALETFGPALVVVQLRFKAKAAKTP